MYGVCLSGKFAIGRGGTVQRGPKEWQSHHKKKSCHSIVIRTYDLRLTIFLFVIGGVIRTYDNAMTFLAIKGWAV